jgi:hypothetical protein
MTANRENRKKFLKFIVNLLFDKNFGTPPKYSNSSF